MANEKQKKAAGMVYNTVIKHLDSMELQYGIMEAPGDDYMISLAVHGDDLPMHMYIIVDADRELVMVKSPEFTKFSEEKMDLAAKAVCVINDAIADGRYALDIDSGRIMWTISSCFKGSLISEDVIHYLIGVSVTTLDRHNELFMALNMGMLDLEGFRAKIG